MTDDDSSELNGIWHDFEVELDGISSVESASERVKFGVCRINWIILKITIKIAK